MAIDISPTKTDTGLLVVEQEWCDHCAVDDDPAAEPGMPQTVVSSTTAADRFAPWLERTVCVLTCGHTVETFEAIPGAIAGMTRPDSVRRLQ
ncbi:hypothetical protein ACFOY4_01350 [Actinomadura syzygii]|uniref:Uncharacterized protein n=1 Tax=Actinomadura syzygii TaxID=1427538 RepID=A0A5D0TTG5_9ACTN|nr:hypothetical protein [Actinomadura syzygii]TYC08605.1 hypothetical protein FXF65_37565 [Actinomadura syzygii]